MKPRIIWNLHNGALVGVLRGRAPDYRGSIPVGQLVHEYQRELASMREWLSKQRRSAEYGALLYWWRCETPEEYQECRRMFGEVLESALVKWRATDRYKLNKKRYQK